tara:strand:+ start:6809 stop:10765 length:3957 start_codon:yes stop_codon:yes gene_type:complete
MSKLKGIFEPFKPYVQNQLNLRKKVLSEGITTNRPDLYYTYTRAKQCVIRMASGVNIRQENDLLDDTEEEKYGIGSQLAQDWVLEGGIMDRNVLSDEDREPTEEEIEAEEAASQEAIDAPQLKIFSYEGVDFAESYTTIFDYNHNKIYDGGMEVYQDAKFRNLQFDTRVQLAETKIIARPDYVRGPRQGISNKTGAYGDTRLRADKDGEFGIVPMPGITDAEIRTKSDDGSLREASINFVCHNRRQLEILETLYMRPGYPILLEWGWAPFISNYNGGTIEGQVNAQPFPVLQEFFNESSDLTYLNQLIIERKQQSSGNYDGFIGNIKNFSFKANESGGYECTTELIAHGEILESLKSAKITIPTHLAPNSNDVNVQVIDRFTYLLRSIKANLDRAGNNKYINMKGTSEDITSMFDGPGYIFHKGFWSEFLWFGDGSTGTTSDGVAKQKKDQKAGKDNKALKSSQIKLKKIDDVYLKGFSIITDLIKNIMKVSSADLAKELKRDVRMEKRGYDSLLYGTFMQETSITEETRTKHENDESDQGAARDGKNINDTQKKEKTVYVRWDLMCQIINHLITPGYKKKHEPLVELSYLNDGQRAYDNRLNDGKIFSKTDPNPKNNWYNKDANPKHYLDYSLPSDNKLNPAVDDKKLQELLGQSFDYGVCAMPHQFRDSLILDKYKNKNYEIHVTGSVNEDGDYVNEDGVKDGSIDPATGEKWTAAAAIADMKAKGKTGAAYHKEYRPDLAEKKVDFDDKDNAEFDQDNHNAAENYQPLTSYTDVRFTNQSIGLIYFNLDHLLTTYESMRYENVSTPVKGGEDKKEMRLKEKFSFYDFLDRIWGDVNTACAGYYDFSIQTEHERPHVARVVDKTITGEVPTDIYTFVPQGTNSITRDFNFSSKISSDMADIVSIAAQSPNNAQSLDAMSFKSFHKNIQNRFTDDELDAKSMAEQADVALVTLKKDMKKYRELLRDLSDYQKRSNNQYRAEIAEKTQYFGDGHAMFHSNLGAPAAIEIAKQLEGLLISINARYPLKTSMHGPDHPKAGQYNMEATSDRNAIIPLEFNLRMDGISGISPLNLFKIHPDKLPHGYQRGDIAFIVKGESQKISATQDWTTELNGQLTLLNTSPGDGANELSDDIIVNVDYLDDVDGEQHGEKTPQGPKDGLINPVAHSIFITSPWGKERKADKGWIRHFGVDIRASKRGVSGDDILAPADGVVKKAKFQTGACGGTIEITHSTTGDLFQTRYCHIKEMKVKKGQTVKQGDVIGIMGGNIADKGRGSSKATHLHYEVYDGEANPTWWPKVSNGTAINKKKTGTSDPSKYLS